MSGNDQHGGGQHGGDAKPIIVSLLEPLAPVAVEGKADLADERVVELLVRGYVDHCLDLFHAAVSGDVSQDDAIEDIFNNASALNAVFLGTSGIPGISTHPWNSPDQLGVFLRDTVGLDFPPDECVRATFIHLATHLMHTLQASKEEWQRQIESLIIEVRDLLLGNLPEDGAAPPAG